MLKDNQPSSPLPRVNVPLQQAIEALLTDRPVAYHPILAHALGSAIAAILLSQFLYWLPRSRDQEGWFYKDRDEIQAETGLTRDNQETARRVLRDAAILEERYAGMPKRLFFRIDITGLTQRLSSYVERPAPSEKTQLGAFHPTSRVHSTRLIQRVQRVLQKDNNKAPVTWTTHAHLGHQRTVLLFLRKLLMEPLTRWRFHHPRSHTVSRALCPALRHLQQELQCQPCQ